LSSLTEQKFKKPAAIKREVAGRPILPRVLEEKPKAPEVASPVAAPPPEVEKTEKTENPIKFGGFLDVYYTYNTNNPSAPAAPVAPATQPAGQNGPRYYDIYHNKLSLNLAEVDIYKEAEPVGFRLDLAFGSFAEQNVASDSVSKNIAQAYVTYKPTSIKGLTFDFGKIYTHMGLELPHAQDNFNYSRSLTYGFALPFWHVGLKTTYVLVPDLLTVAGAIYNGWGVDLNDNNTAKTLGLQAVFTPTKDLTVYYNAIRGPELTNDNDSVRLVQDVNASWNATDQLTLAFDLVHGAESQGANARTWTSFEALAKYSLNEWYSISPRFEYFDDTQDAIAGLGSLGFGPVNVWNVTLTNTFTLQKNFELRFEWRYDKANSNIYLNNSKNSQMTFTLAGLFRF
jgi:predicted porin